MSSSKSLTRQQLPSKRLKSERSCKTVVKTLGTTMNRKCESKIYCCNNIISTLAELGRMEVE